MTESFYVNDHWTQFAAVLSSLTHRAGCTWTTLCNGVDAVTGGRNRPNPDRIHALVKPSEETAPTTPGWSLTDAVLAMHRYGMTLEDRTGQGWDAVVDALESDHYVVLQGDSEEFPDGTCSGKFDGDHCIGVHPKKKVENGIVWRWCDDPICPEGRWIKESTLQRYAEKLWRSIRFAVFVQRVPEWRWIRTPLPGHDTAGFYVFTVVDGVITKRRKARTPKGGMNVACTPVPKDPTPWPGHKPKKLVRLLAGAHKGEYVHARRARKVTYP